MAKARVVIHLGCTRCGLRSYSYRVSKKRVFPKLDLKKYCKKCLSHGSHKETK